MTPDREQLLIRIIREGPRKYRWTLFRDGENEFDGSASSRREAKRKAKRVIRRWLNSRFPVRVEVIAHEEAL